MNKVIIMGNLGQDPDVRYMPSGSAVTQLSVATNRSWKDKSSGEQKDETSWHRCVAYGKTAEIIAEHFTKGRKILIEGRLKYGEYDDKDGIKRYTTDIVIDRFEFVEKREGTRPPHAADRDQDGMPPHSRTDADDQERPPEHTGESGSTDDFDDDIPF